ncbi:MAG TPA: ADP-heptose--LPS heptosyltransferase, partial [Rhodanobacteraceae bacterium]|nr:ADP-heptose--LPS heptosyltransferase [Rhodanobacteraceae bacterium]
MPQAPESLCLLRTSALGDVTHVVPLVRTLQAAWPQTRLTWIIGKLEHKLVGDIPGVEFVVFDKAAG